MRPSPCVVDRWQLGSKTTIGTPKRKGTKLTKTKTDFLLILENAKHLNFFFNSERFVSSLNLAQV